MEPNGPGIHEEEVSEVEIAVMGLYGQLSHGWFFMARRETLGNTHVQAGEVAVSSKSCLDFSTFDLFWLYLFVHCNVISIGSHSNSSN